MRMTAILMAILVAGCETGGIGAAECGANQAGDLVGQSLIDLTDATFPATVTRFINPGDAITEDVRPDRMNITLDENGVVTGVFCG
ncbi:MAG: I78 family peptidase inhibitor [Pseudomonadota bacterium]